MASLFIYNITKAILFKAPNPQFVTLYGLAIPYLKTLAQSIHLPLLTLVLSSYNHQYIKYCIYTIYLM